MQSNIAGRKPDFRDVTQIMKERDKVIINSRRGGLIYGLTCTVDYSGLLSGLWPHHGMGHGKH